LQIGSLDVSLFDLIPVSIGCDQWRDRIGPQMPGQATIWRIINRRSSQSASKMWRIRDLKADSLTQNGDPGELEKLAARKYGH
jgi:hypothetical protein